MGLLFISPIIFLSVVLIIANFKSDSILKLLIILGGIAIVLLWQGKDVTFGQRFLIGQLPYAAIVIMQNSKKEKLLVGIFTLQFLFLIWEIYIYTLQKI